MHNNSNAKQDDNDGVEIVAYNPEWPDWAAATITELTNILPGTFIEVEHIGSTAVPGLAAKPIIDLMAAVSDLGIVEAHEDALNALGYKRHFNGMTDRLLYVKEPKNIRTHVLHVVTLDSWPTRNQRILRDYLRLHPQDAKRYEEFKRRIANSGISSNDYAKAKTEMIQELTDRARAELGLPLVSVWEK